MSTGIKTYNNVSQSSVSWERELLSNPSFNFLVVINPNFYKELENLKDLASDTTELQTLVAAVFLNPIDPYNSDESEEEEERRELRYRRFYAAVHRKYVLTEEGMNAIIRRHISGEYGVCPCYRCYNTHLFPAALKDEYGASCVKLFCPSCKEVYNPPIPFDSMDGAFFGAQFIPTLVKQHPEILVRPGPKYEPKIFGFKIHCSSIFVCYIQYFRRFVMDVEAKYNELCNHMKELLDAPSPDYDEVKTTAGNILALHKSFPADLRFRIWEVLLDVAERTEPDFDLMTKMQARFSNDHVLTLDVERSFNSIEEPRKSELRHQLTTIISTYCAKYDVAYWQGMHDMVAVMLLMEPQPPLSKIFLLLSMFLQTFLPYVFDDRDCMFLQHLFEMIRLLLQYHDPQLALYLQQHNIIPSIYSPSWLLTLFAHDMSQSLLLTVWDQYIFYKNPAIHIFTILSHLISNKKWILSYPQSELLELMTHLPFENDESTYVFEERVDSSSSGLSIDQVCVSLNEELRNRTIDPTSLTNIVMEGLKLMHRTPPGFIHRLNDLLNDKVTVSTETLKAYSQAPCVMTTPVEMYTFLLRGVERNVNCLRYLILDTRSASAYRAAHLVGAKNISLHTLENMGKMDLLLRKIRSHEYHVVVLEGEKSKEDVCTEIVRYLVRKQCKYVSEVVGGYDRIVKLIGAEGNIGEDLIVHEAKEHTELETESHEIKGANESHEIKGANESNEIKGANESNEIKEQVESKDSNEKEEKESPKEKTANSEGEKKQEMIKVVNGKQCLLYETWLENPLVKDFACVKVQKVQKEGKDMFVYTTEKRMVLTNGFLFVIDIVNCPERGYAIIDSRYNYSSIELVKATGKDFIYVVIKPNKEGKKKQLLFKVNMRDECISELNHKINQFTFRVCWQTDLLSTPELCFGVGNMSSDTLLKLGGTQNKAWIENAHKSIGMKMMKTMGWKEGEGLGKDGGGQKTHIQIKRRAENEGLGLDESDRTNKTFISTIGNFTDVLEGLNKEHSDVRKQMKKKEKKDKKKKEKKEKRKHKEHKEHKEHGEHKEHKEHKSKKAKDDSSATTKAAARHKYKKVLMNKSISNYSTDDLNAILGISPRDD